jgi:uncharacterized membrane protein YeiB
MKLDIRWPMGVLLLVLGGILSTYGLVSDPALYARSLGHNINLWWGGALMLVGGVMVALARRART